MFPPEFADEIDEKIRALPEQRTEPIRRVRREYTKRLKNETADTVVAVAQALRPKQGWVAWELVHHHKAAMASLTTETVERLGEGLDGWGEVDAFASYISGPAWRDNLIPDEAVQRWTASENRWWRRTALVSTTRLNDTARTTGICGMLTADRDPMVVKALSWALRELSTKDPQAAKDFLDQHDVAPLVGREVRNKLRTGLKSPGARPAR